MAQSIPHRQLKDSTPSTRHAPDRFRGSASERGYDWTWSKPGGVKDQCLERDEYLCQRCLVEGGLVQAMTAMADLVADHIIPAHVRPDLIIDVDNTQCLCRSHNAAKAVLDNEMFGGPNVPVEGLTARQREERRRVGANV